MFNDPVFTNSGHVGRLYCVEVATRRKSSSHRDATRRVSHTGEAMRAAAVSKIKHAQAVLRKRLFHRQRVKLTKISLACVQSYRGVAP